MINNTKIFNNTICKCFSENEIGEKLVFDSFSPTKQRFCFLLAITYLYSPSAFKFLHSCNISKQRNRHPPPHNKQIINCSWLSKGEKSKLIRSIFDCVWWLKALDFECCFSFIFYRALNCRLSLSSATRYCERCAMF